MESFSRSRKPEPRPRRSKEYLIRDLVFHYMRIGCHSEQELMTVRVQEKNATLLLINAYMLPFKAKCVLS